MFALDVLRGVAVLLVLAFHAGNPDLFPEETVSWFQRATSVCWAGVDLFFVLSGFLISGLLFKEIDETGTLRLRRFWLRRGMKIWPSYFATYGFMLVVVCLNHLRVGAHDKLRSELFWAIPNIVFVQNYLPEHRWPNSWSIAVEEHFYLALPLVLFALVAAHRARGKKEAPFRFSGLFAMGAVFCALVLGLRLIDASRPVPNAYNPTHLRADSLCFGVMLGYLYRYRRAVFDRVARFWPLAVVVAPLALLSSFSLGMPWPGYPPAPGEPPHSGNYVSAFTIGFTILYLGLGSLVIIAGAYPQAGLRAPAVVRVPLRGIAFVGVYSYTIYLAQAILPKMPGWFAFARVFRRFWDSLWVDRILFFLVSLVLGVVISHVIERPMLELRDRWLPSTKATRPPESRSAS